MSIQPTETERLPLRHFAEKAYLDYSMYVVLDRALPHIADGLKPVQRRIIYAMSQLGLSATAKPKKSARTVGDVIGKFHPHGDAACYEAMVTLAQPFTCRYPLVDGHGNWGSPDDPKSFAAMRYTEAKLTPYASTLLTELEQGTVNWAPNFDGTINEPRLLPARVPNILVNGATGIAVGMATDVPPHNLRELVAASRLLLGNPQAELQDLLAVMPGPDFPTGCEIVSDSSELHKIYQVGNGMIRTRARWDKERGPAGRVQVVLTNLPPQVSPAKIQEQIAEQMRAKKLPLVDDIRDESDHEHPVRVIVIPRSNRVDFDALMAHLFATTDLERSVRVNLNVIGLDGRPRVKPLREMLCEWLTYRRSTVRRRLEHRLTNVLERLHILDGLLVAYLNLDEVIRIIRFEEDPLKVLMDRFDLSETQANAILDLRLRNLQRIEEQQIRSEQRDLLKERAHLDSLLRSEGRLKKLVQAELDADAERYGDVRRSPIVARPAAQALSSSDVIPVEPITVVLSRAGWIRCAKGHDVETQALSYRGGDSYLVAAQGQSNHALVLLDSGGRAYTLNPVDLPSARSQGEPLTSKLDLAGGASIVALALGAPEDRYVLGGSDGYGFRVVLGSLQGRNRAGKGVLALEGTPFCVGPIRDAASDRLALVTKEGRLLIFAVSELPELSKGKGNKLIALRGSDAIVSSCLIPSGGSLCVVSGKRFFTLKPPDVQLYLGARAGRGRYLPRGFMRVDRLECRLLS